MSTFFPPEVLRKQIRLCYLQLSIIVFEAVNVSLDNTDYSFYRSCLYTFNKCEFMSTILGLYLNSKPSLH